MDQIPTTCHLTCYSATSYHRVIHVGTNDVKPSKSLDDIAVLGNTGIPQNSKTDWNEALVSSIAPHRDNNGTGNRQKRLNLLYLGNKLIYVNQKNIKPPKHCSFGSIHDVKAKVLSSSQIDL